MDIPQEESKKLGIPVAVFIAGVLIAMIGAAAVTYFYFPQVQLIENKIQQGVNQEPAPQTYSSDQYNYTFSYPGEFRLERSATGEGGYVQESIDLKEASGKIRMSVKVIAKKGVQCPYFSLDQFVHCAFLRWQNLASVPVTVNGKKGIRLVGQGQLPPYDVQVSTYFEREDFVFEINDFIGTAQLDGKYQKLLQDFSF